MLYVEVEGPRPLETPPGGVPDVVDTPEVLDRAVQALAAGTGPVAVDAERASGYRYGQRAFLVQLRREGAGTVLIDPVALPDLTTVSKAVEGIEWVLHAASQDLPCLAEVGMRPTGELFDTELGARLAGFEKVGLAAVVEQLLGWQLAKEHSAVDWSTRPLPEPWLRYAALDVEVLIDLREALAEELEKQGKLDWARQEFAAVRDTPAPGPRTDPWRRTSGIHRLRSGRQLAVLRELWAERDEIALQRDQAPGRVLPDRALISAVTEAPRTVAALTALPVFSGPANRRRANRWFRAIQRGRAVPDSELPAANVPGDGPPPPRIWKDRDPDAATRLSRARDALTRLSEDLRVPVENLLSPDSLRRLCWRPPAEPGEASVADALRDLGARPWQVALVAPALAQAFATSERDGKRHGNGTDRGDMA